MLRAASGLRRRIAAGGAALGVIASLALMGCTRDGEEPAAPSEPSASSTQRTPSAAPSTSEEDQPTAGGAGPAPSDGGGAHAPDPTDPGSHYLFLPLLDGAETVPAEEVGSEVSNFLESSVSSPDCPGDVLLGEQIRCTGGSIEGDFLEEVSETWDVALVRTTNGNTALIVRAAAEDAGELPLQADQIFHFAYLVGQDETPEVVATATEEGFRATQVSDGPSDVDVTVSCEDGEDLERSMICEVSGGQPADAAGTWFGIGHDSVIEDSAVYLFVEHAGR
ncbi:hypothetical protein GCM10023160_20360 [Brachybacterium paraconglomeratum]